MTADIVNLRQARKARARAEREKEAEVNRARFGRSKAERRLRDAEEKLAERRLDQLQRTPSAGTGDVPEDGGAK